MNKTAIINKMTGIISVAGLKLKKHSPEIMLAAGIGGVVVSGVMACKATLKVNDVLDEKQDNIEKINEVLENPEKYGKTPEDYTEEDAKKDLAVNSIQTGVKLAKLYAPAVILGTASIGCIVGSHRILTKRNVALAAAYATVDKSFKEYRGRVVERFGKELDRELKFNIKAKEIEETVVDEKGKEKKVTKTIDIIDPNTHSEYARFFDDGCKGWDKDAEWNLTFLKQQQNWFNDRLRLKKHVFLNEVYEALGIPKTAAGQIVGWVYDEENPVGDNFIDFGIFDAYNKKARDFVNGRERVILLDFNVDGNILDLM